VLQTFVPVSITSNGIPHSRGLSSRLGQCTLWMEFMPPLPRHSCFLSFYSFITFALPKHGAMSRKVSSTIKSGNSFFVSIQEKVSPRSSKTFVVIIRTRQILASSNSFTCRKSSVSMAVYPILQRIEEGCIVHHRPHHRDE